MWVCQKWMLRSEDLLLKVSGDLHCHSTTRFSQTFCSKVIPFVAREWLISALNDELLYSHLVGCATFI
jgi:hypothetical protein